jgi:hypothetical protein
MQDEGGILESDSTITQIKLTTRYALLAPIDLQHHQCKHAINEHVPRNQLARFRPFIPGTFLFVAHYYEKDNIQFSDNNNK